MALTRLCRASRPTGCTGGRAFSLVELVIVVVIIGIIAAIAAPRFSQATASATAVYVNASVTTVRKAMTHFYAEHGQYPGYSPSTGLPNGVSFVKQLLTYTDEIGNTSATYGAPYIYGPYLRDPFPKNPFNDLSTVTVKAGPSGTVAIGSSGWIAVLSTGDFGINASNVDLSDLNMQPSKVKVGIALLGG